MGSFASLYITGLHPIFEQSYFYLHLICVLWSSLNEVFGDRSLATCVPYLLKQDARKQQRQAKPHRIHRYDVGVLAVGGPMCGGAGQTIDSVKSCPSATLSFGAIAAIAA